MPAQIAPPAATQRADEHDRAGAGNPDRDQRAGERPHHELTLLPDVELSGAHADDGTQRHDQQRRRVVQRVTE